jgi:uncharacterized protein
MKWQWLPLLTGLIITLSGCSGLVGEGTPPTRFFIITPLTLPASNGAVNQEPQEVSIAVEPLKIPAYLDRQQIVIQSGESELNISEFNQWGENLRANLSRVLIENLSLLLDSDRIYLIPGLKRQKPDFKAIVKIIQFERVKNGTVQLTVRWKLYKQQSKKVVFRENALLSGDKVGIEDYPAIAKAMSHLLAEFSQRMAKTIRQQARKMDLGEAG